MKKWIKFDGLSYCPNITKEQLGQLTDDLMVVFDGWSERYPEWQFNLGSSIRTQEEVSDQAQLTQACKDAIGFIRDKEMAYIPEDQLLLKTLLDTAKVILSRIPPEKTQ